MVNAKFFRIVDRNALSKRSVLNLLKLKSLQLTKKTELIFIVYLFFNFLCLFLCSLFYIYGEKEKRTAITLEEGTKSLSL